MYSDLAGREAQQQGDSVTATYLSNEATLLFQQVGVTSTRPMPEQTLYQISFVRVACVYTKCLLKRPYQNVNVLPGLPVYLIQIYEGALFGVCVFVCVCVWRVWQQYFDPANIT